VTEEVENNLVAERRKKRMMRERLLGERERERRVMLRAISLLLRVHLWSPLNSKITMPPLSFPSLSPIPCTAICIP